MLMNSHPPDPEWDEDEMMLPDSARMAAAMDPATVERA
eukprot:CAMPEP_0185820290 /NCGR_PEP_ID=MMETSP1322-20130828/23495_1 /TAXON_ID=265543 /ORGANISM="Minutocellus polymorphus, Strain RCC2270" /LENGTH=37 /DNA_ID= /DNA_START= /DNA_END= /DNA_ORIENTATION=